MASDREVEDFLASHGPFIRGPSAGVVPGGGVPALLRLR